MTYEEFESRAHEVFARVPPDFRVGVEALVVDRAALPDPELVDVYLLGECVTGEWDSPAEPTGELRSTVVLHYGSFLRLSQLDPAFDWEYEIWETVVHEIRHHRESAAGEDALEEVDYAEGESFARREGRPFDPFFYRLGEPVAPGAWEVAGEVFVERPVTLAEQGAAELAVPWGGATLHLPRPPGPGDVHFVALDETGPGDPPLTVVLVRERGAWESLRALFSAREPRVLESRGRARVERAEGA